MRTTVDLPDDIHRTMTAVARERGQTLSAVLVDYVRRGMGARSVPSLRVDPETGFPVVHLGHPVTPEDVRSLDDEA